MPISVSVICIRNTKAEDFLQSSQFLDLKENIFLQRNESDGLYLAMSLSRGGYGDAISEMDENDYLYLNVDDEDDCLIEGSFIPSEEVNMIMKMSIVAKNMKRKKVKDYRHWYNYDFLKELEKNDIEKLNRLKNIIEKEMKGEDIWGIEDAVRDICPDYDYNSFCEKKLAYFELGLSTTVASKNSVFILECSPSLQNFVKWKGVIEDDLSEWQNEYEDNEDDFAYSLYTTYNFELLDSLKEDLGLGEPLRNYPSLLFFGWRGNAQEGWSED